MPIFGRRRGFCLSLLNQSVTGTLVLIDLHRYIAHSRNIHGALDDTTGSRVQMAQKPQDKPEQDPGSDAQSWARGLIESWAKPDIRGCLRLCAEYSKTVLYWYL